MSKVKTKEKTENKEQVKQQIGLPTVGVSKNELFRLKGEAVTQVEIWNNRLRVINEKLAEMLSKEQTAASANATKQENNNKEE